ncbi:hypothetical protein J6590_104889 [Homalodisca vitripennis]|nr:hypothetical protein J6590_104889 [Homalodisca vitripennis]
MSLLVIILFKITVALGKVRLAVLNRSANAWSTALLPQPPLQPGPPLYPRTSDAGVDSSASREAGKQIDCSEETEGAADITRSG